MKKVIITLICFSLFYVVVSSLYKNHAARKEEQLARLTGGWSPRANPEGTELWEFYKDGTALWTKKNSTSDLKGNLLTRIETSDEQSANWTMDGDAVTVIEVNVTRDAGGNPTGMTRGDTLTARLEPVAGGHELVFDGTGERYVKTFAKHKAAGE